QAEQNEGTAAASSVGDEQPVPEGVPEVSSLPLETEPVGIEAGEGNAAPDADAEAVAAKRAARNEERAVREYLRKVLDALMAELDRGERGVEIREIAGGYRMATKPEYHDAIRSFVKSLKPPMKLSLQALETLAVVAYKQPVTGPEISEIRGVESAGVLGSLLSRKLITTAGRKQVIGRPILYKTTKEFLLRFGLKDLNELPSIEEFEKMAGELADAELEPAHQGGLTTSEAERSLNEDDDEADESEGEEVAPINNATADASADTAADDAANPPVEEATAAEPVMEEQKAGEA
ncbi:MAG TPA: SMC-Scp complex subunit ScpB, partial [Acidobacteriaceae bacterium]|nr:SMC-Scp complex subunit ScpB [Acidobacteriaceae bacterium]